MHFFPRVWSDKLPLTQVTNEGAMFFWHDTIPLPRVSFALVTREAQNGSFHNQGLHVLLNNAAILPKHIHVNNIDCPSLKSNNSNRTPSEGQATQQRLSSCSRPRSACGRTCACNNGRDLTEDNMRKHRTQLDTCRGCSNAKDLLEDDMEGPIWSGDHLPKTHNAGDSSELAQCGDLREGVCVPVGPAVGVR
jgi:hypothetical protein